MTRTNRIIKQYPLQIPNWSNATNDFIDLSTAAKSGTVGDGYLTSSDGWLLIASSGNHSNISVYVNEVLFTSPSNINNPENTVTVPVRKGDRIRYSVAFETQFGLPSVIRFYPTN